MVIGKDPNPAQTSATLMQHATYMTARTIQPTADAKPLLKQLSNYPIARDAYKEALSSDNLHNAAQKAYLSPEMLDGLASANSKAKTPEMGARNIPEKARTDLGAPQQRPPSLPEPAARTPPTPGREGPSSARS